MPFKKGQSGNPQGRKEGVPNKLTRTAKEAFQLAFDELGGWEGLAQWASKDPENRKVFYSLYARLIPTDITSKDEKITSNEIHITREVIGGK